MKFKKGDKVSIKKDIKDDYSTVVSGYVGKPCKILSLTGYNGRKDTYTVDIPYGPNGNCLYVKPEDLEYWYKEPLRELWGKIYNDRNSDYYEDITIRVMIENPNKLSDNEINFARDVWEKYN